MIIQLGMFIMDVLSYSLFILYTKLYQFQFSSKSLVSMVWRHMSWRICHYNYKDTEWCFYLHKHFRKKSESYMYVWKAWKFQHMPHLHITRPPNIWKSKFIILSLKINIFWWKFIVCRVALFRPISTQIALVLHFFRWSHLLYKMLILVPLAKLLFGSGSCC